MKQHLVSLTLMTGAALFFFYLSQKKLTEPWLNLALNPEINESLMTAIDNQKKLARLDREEAETYKGQFQETQALLQHLEILQANRVRLYERYEKLLLALFGVCLLLIAALQLWRSYHLDRRLQGIRADVEALAMGETRVKRRDRRKDLLGKIGAMIEHASSVLAVARQRVSALENLESWQESSRRIAHEIRTPLTALRLETRKMIKECIKAAPRAAESLQGYEQSILEEIKNLGEFTDQYTSFSKVGRPITEPKSLSEFLDDFIRVYGEAWPELQLEWEGDQQDREPVQIDRRLVRQVIVNLCNNSALAMGEQGGKIHFSINDEPGRVLLTVRDNGPGIPESIRERIFEPYTTTRKVGKGMGLGLAISRKIMLDHGGDLELAENSSEGAAFRLIWPVEEKSE